MCVPDWSEKVCVLGVLAYRHWHARMLYLCCQWVFNYLRASGCSEMEVKNVYWSRNSSIDYCVISYLFSLTRLWALVGLNPEYFIRLVY